MKRLFVLFVLLLSCSLASADTLAGHTLTADWYSAGALVAHADFSTVSPLSGFAGLWNISAGDTSLTMTLSAPLTFAPSPFSDALVFDLDHLTPLSFSINSLTGVSGSAVGSLVVINISESLAAGTEVDANFTLAPAGVPEPSSIALLAAPLLGLVGRTRIRSRMPCKQ